MKKGDMSINMIVVAAIALLVLVIIAFVFSDALFNFDQGTGCEGVGGFCADSVSCWEPNENYGGTWLPSTSFKCSSEDRPVCCIKQG